MKTTLITGANGQDASYLAELLLSKGYKVYGTIRRNSVPESQTTRIKHIYPHKDLELFYADLTDYSSIQNIIHSKQPDEIYHLAAQSHVQISFELPQYTLDANCGGTLSVLEAAKKFCPHSKIYFAGTSEMFGNNKDADGFQRETTRMTPVSPYGCSKLYGLNLCNNYRNSYNMFISSGILFNHESERRGINFVTNKIACGAVKILLNQEKHLRLGNLNASRDWGHAKDYVNAMWLMLQQDVPKDYVIATGETRTVQQFLSTVFAKLGLEEDKHVIIDEKYMRPEELDFLRGDSSKARLELGWKPTMSFDSMVDEMIEYWLKHFKK